MDIKNLGCRSAISQRQRDFWNLFDLRNFTVMSVLPLGKDRILFLSCMRKGLVIVDIFQDLIRAFDALWQLARFLPTLLLSHSRCYESIQTQSNRF